MNSRTFSILGLFDSAQHLMDAIPAVKSKVSARLDACTPYPVHGLEEALGLRKSPVGGMVFVMGLIGAVSALAFELWTAGVDYPLVTAGKPYLSWEAFVPILFETMVLFACFTAGLGMLFLLNRLPMFRHPMLRAKSMPLITRDKFALVVEADGQPLDVKAVSAALQAAGAEAIEVVEQPEAPGPISPNFVFRVAAVIVFACLAAGYLTYWAVKLFPVTVPVVHMLDQPRVNPQRESGFFKNGSAMRMPPAGTVARGQMPYAIEKQSDAAALANPLPRTPAALKKGKQGFATYCAVCHGVLGDGAGSLTAAYGAKPANLTAQTIRDYSDGEIYHVIMRGKNAMLSYGADLSEDQRWAVVHYVRALQRALNARDEDIPRETRK